MRFLKLEKKDYLIFSLIFLFILFIWYIFIFKIKRFGYQLYSPFLGIYFLPSFIILVTFLNLSLAFLVKPYNLKLFYFWLFLTLFIEILILVFGILI